MNGRISSTIDDDQVIVVIGGHAPDPHVLDRLPTTRHVVCADSGLDHALSLDLSPSVLIGDMDSVDPRNLIRARSSACTVIEHSTDKDKTDTELALAHVVSAGHKHLHLVWGGGDRIDHVLGVIAALAHPRLSALTQVTAWIGRDRFDVVHEGRSCLIDLPIGTTLSLVCLGGTSAVVSTRGLRWNVLKGPITSDSARGVSNVTASDSSGIVVHSGTIGIIVPDCLSASLRSSRLDASPTDSKEI